MDYRKFKLHPNKRTDALSYQNTVFLRPDSLEGLFGKPHPRYHYTFTNKFNTPILLKPMRTIHTTTTVPFEIHCNNAGTAIHFKYWITAMFNHATMLLI